jgi:hypothetical protein
LNSLGRRSPRLGSTLRPRPQFSEQGSNLCLRFQRPPSCRLDDPRARPPVENRTRVSRLSCGRSAIELRAAASCPVQELNLALRLFKPTLVTTRASGAKAGKVDCFPAAVCSSSIFREHERSDRSRESAGSRTPFARVRTECLAVKASDPRQMWLPSVGLEPTQSGSKGRCPAHWASTANTRIHAPRWGSPIASRFHDWPPERKKGRRGFPGRPSVE